jgi:hypothetical protein
MSSANRTSVVSVRAQNLRPKYRNLKEWMEFADNEYIGRGGVVFIGNKQFTYHGSKWGNPFKITKDCSRDECIRQFEVYIRDKIQAENLQEELLSLKGKALGCWCKPEACHGDVLLRLIEEYSLLYGTKESSGPAATSAVSGPSSDGREAPRP